MRRFAAAVVVVALAVAGAPHVAGAAFAGTARARSTVTAGVLAAPTGLVASNAGCALLVPRVRLDWTATTTPWATGYVVERSTGGSGGTYTQVATVTAPAVTATIGGLSVLSTYWFRVRATYGGWRSAPSNVASFSTGLC